MKHRIAAVFLAVFLLLPSLTAAEIPSDVFTETETVTEDRENGHWSYSSDSFAVIIDRHHGTVLDEDNREQPLVWLVAHIYERNYNSFRSGLSNPNGADSNNLIKPALMARRDRAVIAITGDNLTQQEPEKKGAIVRQGRVYNNRNAESVMAMTDDLSMTIYMAGEMRAEDFLEAGIRETYSFGPWLIKDGEPNPDVAKFRVNRVNPRVGVGMVEPGHFVVIVVDGRQDKYSYGLNLPEFRDMFVAEGCVQAYNLDGGCSTGLVFMGEHLNYHDGSSGAADYQRPWSDALEWGYSELVPGENDPYLYDGNHNKR